MTRVLVTGATGFLGAHIVDALFARNAEVRALVRATSETTALRKRGVELVVGDVMTGEGCDDAVRDVDVVIHAAGGGKVKRMQDMQAQNTASTAHLMRALGSAGSDARFVLTSSMAAMGPARNRRPVTSGDAPHPASAYGRSKLAAEHIVFAEKHTRHVTVIRPPGVYGPGDTRFVTLFRAINKGIAPLPPGRTLSVIYGPDCADALVRAAFGDHASGQAFHIEDGEIHTWRSIAEHIATALQKRPLYVTVPSSVLYVAGTASEAIGRVRDEAVVLTRDKWRDGKQLDWTTRSDETRRELGWKPATTFAEGAAVTATWYRDEGWL